MPRFTIKGVGTYETAALDKISLLDLMMFNQQAADLGMPYAWDEVEAIAHKLDDIVQWEGAGSDPATKPPEVSRRDEVLLLAVTVWASRRIAGDQVSFAEAINFPMTDYDMLPDPQDRKAPGNPQKPPRKPQRSRRPASVAAAADLSDEPGE